MVFSSVIFFCCLQLALTSESAVDLGYFVHITDVHIDVSYKPGTNPFCEKWTCCRENSTFSPTKNSNTVTAGMFGAPSSGHCGVPIETLDGVLEFVRDYPYVGGVKPTAILFTGDNTVNDCDKARGGCPRSQIINTVDLINSHILSDLGTWCKPPCAILRAMGNHDGEPTENLELMPKGSWLVDHFADFQEHYVDPTTAAFFREKGYLSVTLGKMRIIAVNTQWTSKSNDYNKAYPTEKTHPMTEWMRSEVKSAKESGLAVVTIGHIPFTDFSRNYEVWNTDWLEIQRTYSDTIKLSLWGHLHQNELYMTRDEAGHPIGYHIVTGSVTNQGERNTVITMVQYDKSTNEIVDIAQYYNDIEASNSQKTMKNNWHLLRSFRHDFQMKDLSPSSMDLVVSNLKTNQTLWNLFQKHRYSNYRDSVVCEGSCRKDFLCAMEHTSMEKISACEHS